MQPYLCGGAVLVLAEARLLYIRAMLADLWFQPLVFLPLAGAEGHVRTLYSAAFAAKVLPSTLPSYGMLVPTRGRANSARSSTLFGRTSPQSCRARPGASPAPSTPM